MSKLSFLSSCLLSFTLFLSLLPSSSSGSIQYPKQRHVLPSPHFHIHQMEGYAGIVPALFVFGDSIVDNGNNVFLKDTSGNINYLPYGIDFPKGPTGRFTNGKNPSDWLALLLGLPYYIPAAKDPQTKGVNVMHGVNYASGGSGILDDTCRGACISLGQQINHFQNQTLPDLRSQLKNNDDMSSSFLAKSLFVFNTGGSDCSRNCSSSEIIEPIVGNLTQQIKKLYDLGARKFVLFGVQAIGCTPSARKTMQDGRVGGCVEQMNQAAIDFNSILNSSLDSLQSQMAGSSLVYVDTYSIVRSIYDNTSSMKMKVTNETCCTLSSQGSLCAKGGKTCQDRYSYLYFDGLHFTDIFYSHLAITAFLSRDPKEVHPHNIRHLASL